MMTDQLPSQQQQQQHVPGSSNQTKTTFEELWVCDVCKTAKFADFDEACRHEEECSRIQQQQQREQEQTKKAKKAEPQAAAAAKPVHPFFGKPMTATAAAASKKTQSNDDDNNDATLSISNDDSSSNKSKRKKSSKDKDAASKKKKKKESKSTTTSQQTTLVGATATTLPNQAALGENKLLQNGSATTNDKNKRKSSSSSSSSSDSIVEIVKVAKKPKPKKGSKSADSSTTKAPVASIFRKGSNGKSIDEKTLLAEQKAVEFQAKRRLERERERERQRKRQELFFHNKATTTNINHNDSTTTSATTHKKPMAQQNEQVKVKGVPCPLFPVPNHVLGGSSPLHLPEKQTSHIHVTDEQLSQARKVLQKTLPYPDGREKLQFTMEGESTWEFGSSSSTGNNHHASSLIQQELANVLALSSNPTFNKNDKNRLWVDKYMATWDDSETTTICGRQNQAAAQELRSFVQDWMVQRHQSNVRMAERQKALQRKKPSKQKKSKIQYKNDDDLYFDSDDNDESNHTLPSLCLIQGPVASCKSSLVHAVAKQCDCQILELNTSVERGSTSLRKALEEAVQSHSSMDMLKKQQASLFAQQQLVDSDDDDDGTTKDKQGSSLTIILIDEVDNLYEGDNGFWSALSALTKKARCPVFLTANVYPPQLDSSSFAFKYVETSRPSPEECASRMAHIIQQEGISVMSSSSSKEGSKSADPLVSIAELCGCDLRRILHELQLFSYTQNNMKESVQKADHPVGMEAAAQELTAVVTPNITNVSPKTVDAEQCTLLTIKGQHFYSLVVSLNQDGAVVEQPVRVLVGSQVCPRACIVDDETILAVCPPSQRPGDVDKYGLRLNQKTSMRMSSLNTQFASLKVQAIHSSSGRSIMLSSTPVAELSLLDDTTLPVVSPCNIEYSFPELEPNLVNGRLTEKEDATSDGEEAEFEFGSGASQGLGKLLSSSWNESHVSTLEASVGKVVPLEANRETILETADRLIQKGLAKWKAAMQSETPAPSTESAINVDRDLASTLDSMASDYQLASDAALLEDYGSLPYLSGAMPGFGFEFTPEGNMASSNASSKLTYHGSDVQCPWERLITTGWNDTACYYGANETYVTVPAGIRERRMLKQGEAFGRNGFSMVADTIANDKEEGKSDDQAEDLTMWTPPTSNRSEEDLYLPRPIPTSLLSLPSILMDARRLKTDDAGKKLNDELLEGRKDANSQNLLQLLGSIIPHKEYQAKLFCLGLGRCQCGSVLEYDNDASLSLDYIPMLRNIAVHERAAESDPESHKERNAGHGGRKTRRSAKRGRIHFFEKLSGTDTFLLGDSELSASAVGQKLAQTPLRY